MTSIAINSERRPLRERVNLRILVFVTVLVAPILWALTGLIREELTGGIQDVGDGYKLVNLEALCNFTFDQVNGRDEDVPQKWRALDGQKVILYGEIFAPNTTSDMLDRFDLCYSIAKCCFSGPPQVQHFVKSKTINGPVPYYGGLVKVKGTLHVKVSRNADKVDTVYAMDVESVEPEI